MARTTNWISRRFEEFQITQPSRGHLPEPLWRKAAELATRYGLNATVRALRLDYNGLKKRMEVPDRPKRERKETAVPAFVELVRPVPCTTNQGVDLAGHP